jgi:hypothetical protein
MSKQRILSLRTSKVTGTKVSGESILEKITVKLIEGPSLTNFYKYMNVQRYASVELMDVKVSKGKTYIKGTKEDFEECNSTLLEKLKEYKITNGVKETVIDTTEIDELTKSNEAKDKELEELRAKLAAKDANLVKKELKDMLEDELVDYINEKGYLIPVAQAKDELLTQIIAAEARTEN